MTDYKWVFCAGNRRTGSTVHYHITRELLEHTGEGKGFGAIPGGAIGQIKGWDIYDIDRKYKKIKAFRTHQPTDQVIKVLNRLEHRGQTRCIYIYRDPRDSMVSVIKRDEKDFNTLINSWMKNRVLIDEFWRDRKPVLISRYEDNIVFNNIRAEAWKIAKFLDLEVEEDFLSHLQEKYNRDSVKKNKNFYKEVSNGWAVGYGGLRPFLPDHIQSGTWGRWVDFFSPEEQKQIESVMADYLKERGYPLYEEVVSALERDENPYDLIEQKVNV